MKRLLKHIARYIFEHGAERHTYEKQGDKMLDIAESGKIIRDPAIQNERAYHNAGAVNRAKRPEKETPLDRRFIAKGIHDRFIDPADNAEKNKNKEIIDREVDYFHTRSPPH